MEQFIKSPRSDRWFIAMAVAGLLIFSLSLSLLMVPYSTVIEENEGGDLTCLHIPFTKSRAAAILNSYNAEALEAAQSLHFPGDLIFPIGYALLYAGLIGLLLRGQQGWWLRAGLVVLALPFVAMLFDWIENLFILRMLAITAEEGAAAIPARLPLIGGIAGSIKYVALSLVTPLFGIALITRSTLTRQPPLTKWRIVTFLVALSLLAFNLVQLITGVLPCLS